MTASESLTRALAERYRLERGTTALARRRESFDLLAAPDPLEAELRCAFICEGVDQEPEMLHAISRVAPDRPLHDRIARVVRTGHVRGADYRPLTAALHLAEAAEAIAFLTLDERQAAAARALGFRP